MKQTIAALLLAPVTVHAQGEPTTSQAQPFPPVSEVSVFLGVYSPQEAVELTADPDAPFWRDVPGIVVDRRIDTGEVVLRLPM